MQSMLKIASFIEVYLLGGCKVLSEAVLQLTKILFSLLRHTQKFLVRSFDLK